MVHFCMSFVASVGRTLILTVASLLSLTLASNVAAAAPGVATTWRMLDYVAVDYGAAVSDGKVSNQFEYDEMIEFSKSVAERIASLPASPNKSALQQAAEELRQSIEARRPAGEVAQRARGLAAALLTEHPVPLAPRKAPDMERAVTLFAQNCASCHGSAGRSPPSQLMNIDPRRSTSPISSGRGSAARSASIKSSRRVLKARPCQASPPFPIKTVGP